MALLKDGITAANECAENMQLAVKDIVSISNDILANLNRDSNFQIFKEGTSKGARIFNDLTKCVNTITDSLAPTIDSVINETNNLTGRQQNLNSAEVNYETYSNMRNVDVRY